MSRINMAVINLFVSYNMRENARFIAGMTSDHHQQASVLNLIDTSWTRSSKHITTALNQHHIQILATHIPNSLERTRCKTRSLT